METSLRVKNFIRVFILHSLLFFPTLFKCQTTNIGGIINDYASITSFDTTGCKARIVVSSATAFSVGDSVLVIQMKGANFDSTNTSAFGSIINLSGAGNYEIAAIYSISSNTIMLNGKLIKKYLSKGYLQLVRIPSYVNALITASLTCQPWNGQTGGVLILSVQNNLTFNADIDVSGTGFRGGTISMNPDGNCGGGSPNYYYDVNQPGGLWPSGGAQKGEGIGSISTSKGAGKGRLVNGGGGGSKHNSAGGGGSNYTAGGRGGAEYVACGGGNNGLGGLGLSTSYTNNVIFAGGGGGCGDYNNNQGTGGENGGGIVIITTSSLTGNNYIVKANGNTVTAVAGISGDGAGGGGGGGTIFVNTGTILSPVTLIANGGGGGDQGASDCVGPGGGGGSGTILTNLSSPAGLNYTLMPGPAGTFINANCALPNWGALAGTTNTTGPLTSRNLLHTPSAIPFIGSVPNVSVCSGLTLGFTTTLVADSYSWNGPSLTSIVQNTAIASTSTLDTGSYTLTASSLNGCISIISKSVTVRPTPTVSVPNFSVCAGLTINIIPVEVLAFTYNWAGPNSFSSTLPTVSLTNASPAMAGNYNLTVTSVFGCTASATGSIGVAVVNGITVSINTPVCEGRTLTLSTGGGSGGLAYLWTGPGTYTSSLQNPTITPVSLSDAGGYTLTASVNGCSATPISSMVTVEAYPVISVSNVSVCSGHSVSLGASSPTGVNYTWTGPGSFAASTPTINFANASATMSGAYNLTVTSALGCTSTASANISVTVTPVISLSSNQPVCQGSVLNFTTSGGTSYLLLGPNNFSSAVADPSITNVPLAASGNYTLTGSALTCSATATSSVVIKPPPIPIIGTLSPVCKPRDFRLTALGGITYTWTGPANFTSTIQNPTVSPSSFATAGVYTVVVTSVNGCTASATTTITVITTPTVSASGSTVCPLQNATLNAGGALSYTWTGPGGFSSNSPSPVVPAVNNNSAGSYSLLVITANTCTVLTTVDLGLYPLPTPTITAPAKVCINSVVYFLGSGGVAYSWKGPANFSSAVQNPSVIPLNFTFSGDYSLTAQSAQGCTATTTSNLALYALPNAKLSGRVEGCAPFCSEFEYKPVGLSSLKSTTWNVGQQYSVGIKYNYCFPTPGVVLITGFIEDTLGCKNTNSFNVNVRPSPTADFEYSPLKPIENIDKVVFTNTSTGDNIDLLNWYVIDKFGFAGHSSTASHFFETAGSFPVVLTVRNNWGCWDTIIKAIEIGVDFNIFIPNVFTPNGDGKNEFFQPKGMGIVSYQLIIYDRWHQKMFATSTFEEGWDGNFKGFPCKSDVYVWEMIVEKINGTKKALTGEVLLNR